MPPKKRAVAEKPSPKGVIPAPVSASPNNNKNQKKSAGAPRKIIKKQTPSANQPSSANKSKKIEPQPRKLTRSQQKKIKQQEQQQKLKQKQIIQQHNQKVKPQSKPQQQQQNDDDDNEQQSSDENSDQNSQSSQQQQDGQQKKSKKNQQQQQEEEQSSSQRNINSSDQQGDQQDNSQQDSSQQQQLIKPQNYAVRNMTFRQRRGTKMNYLINRKKQQEQDPFWAQQGANYFGDIDAGDDQDQQDYVQSSSGRDYFDSDFGQTQSQHNKQKQGQQKEDDQQQEDQDKLKQRKKKIQLMKKIKGNNLQSDKQGILSGGDKKRASKKSIQQQKQQQGRSRYIHQAFTQQQLLGQAAHTQYINWLSYRKLISIQVEKKDYTIKSHHVQGDKMIFRDKIGESGKRQVSYQLCGVQVNKIQDLTSAWKS